MVVYLRTKKHQAVNRREAQRRKRVVSSLTLLNGQQKVKTGAPLSCITALSFSLRQPGRQVGVTQWASRWSISRLFQASAQHPPHSSPLYLYNSLLLMRSQKEKKFLTVGTAQLHDCQPAPCNSQRQWLQEQERCLLRDSL